MAAPREVPRPPTVDEVIARSIATLTILRELLATPWPASLRGLTAIAISADPSTGEVYAQFSLYFDERAHAGRSEMEAFVEHLEGKALAGGCCLSTSGTAHYGVMGRYVVTELQDVTYECRLYIVKAPPAIQASENVDLRY